MGGIQASVRHGAVSVDHLEVINDEEIACLLDFGVETERVMLSLPALNEVRKEIQGNVVDLEKIAEVAPFANDESFRDNWQAVKRRNKHRLADYVQRETGIVRSVPS